jgi:hypothetical protein
MTLPQTLATLFAFHQRMHQLRIPVGDFDDVEFNWVFKDRYVVVSVDCQPPEKGWWYCVRSPDELLVDVLNKKSKKPKSKKL